MDTTPLIMGHPFATKQYFDLERLVHSQGQGHQIYTLNSARLGLSCVKNLLVYHFPLQSFVIIAQGSKDF